MVGFLSDLNLAPSLRAGLNSVGKTNHVGSLFIPVDDDSTGIDQSVWRIEKDDDGNVTRKRLFGVRYVPLSDAPK